MIRHLPKQTLLTALLILLVSEKGFELIEQRDYDSATSP
jgi:hypothetical protein